MLEFFKKPKNFLNKGTKNKKTYMEGLNWRNKNIKGGGFPKEGYGYSRKLGY